MAWRESSHLTRRIARDRKNQRADAQHRERRKKTRTKTQALDGAPLHPSLAKALDETAGTQTDAKTLAACVPRDRVRKWAEHCARALAQFEADGDRIRAVVGDVGFKTAYHLDYAEVFRHRTNVIRPPLHAATLQVSPVPPGSFAGGCFGAHLDGLEHYEKHGYKNRRQPTGDLPTTDWDSCKRWAFAPYRFNQVRG